MGQPVAVVEVTSESHPGIVKFETNRPLSGMGHRSYASADDALDPLDPADELARRLYARGGIDHLHINGSVITIDVAKGHDTAGITELIAGLFTHYVE